MKRVTFRSDISRKLTLKIWFHTSIGTTNFSGDCPKMVKNTHPKGSGRNFLIIASVKKLIFAKQGTKRIFKANYLKFKIFALDLPMFHWKVLQNFKKDFHYNLQECWKIITGKQLSANSVTNSGLFSKHNTLPVFPLDQLCTSIFIFVGLWWYPALWRCQWWKIWILHGQVSIYLCPEP